MTRLASALLAVVVVGGCDGVISLPPGAPAAGGPGTPGLPGFPPAPAGGGSGSAGGGGGGELGFPRPRAQFQCTTPRETRTVPLRRLSRAQYLNTVESVVRTLAPTDATAVLATVRATLERFPIDAKVGAPNDRHGGFSAADQTIQQGHADAAYAVAVAVGAELTSTPERRQRLLGACATDASTANDAACLSAFVAKATPLVLRRPARADDLAFYAAGTSTAPVSAAVVADVVALLFTSPAMQFHVEHGTGSASPAPLDAHELASRLAYQFWRGPPDAALRTKADDGTLLQPAVLAAELERMLAHADATRAFDEVFSEWLQLDDLPELDGLAGTPKFKAYAGDALPGPDAREAAIADVLASVRATVRERGSASALLSDRRAYASTPWLAKIYGTPVWNGADAAPPAGPSRAGLLTRVAMVASGLPDTRPIHKGLRLRTALLCQQVAPPPAAAAGAKVEPGPNATTREATEALTETTAACGGCHKGLINPLGFVTEGFDGLGRERTVQTLYDAAGTVLAQRAVNTRVEARLVPEDSRVAEDAVVLTAQLDDSGLFHSCLARQWFRFTFARMEDDLRDGCVLSELETALQRGDGLAQALANIALSPEFHERSFP